MKWTFENYRLDTENASLWRDEEEIGLRPKTFDVLCYLVEHAGELVSKETLLEEVWKDRYVVEGIWKYHPPRRFPPIPARPPIPAAHRLPVAR